MAFADAELFVGEDAEEALLTLGAFFGEGDEPGTRAMLPRYLPDFCPEQPLETAPARSVMGDLLAFRVGL